MEALRAQMRWHFETARDPTIRLQHEANQRTEAQRRESDEADDWRGRNSEMVKDDRPHPELHPRDDREARRASFDERWAREHWEAAQAELQREREAQLSELGDTLAKQQDRGYEQAR